MESVIKRFDELTLNELYDCMRLRFDVFVIEQACLYQDIDDKDQASYHLMYRDAEGNLSGYLRILDAGVSYDEVSIGRVAVSKSARATGLGRKIMEDAIAFVRSSYPNQTVRISAQAYLLKFYTSLGFEAVSEVYLEDDIPHVEMVLAI